MAIGIGTCNIYGESIYGEYIYAESCFYNYYDFRVSVYNLDTDQLVENVQWELYRRDYNKPHDELVNENHILVDSDIVYNGIVQISLIDYNLRFVTTDYYLKTWRTDNPNYIGRLRIKYLADDYVVKDENWPYIREALQIAPHRGGSGGMGGSVTHTEYIDKPLPVIKIKCVEDEDDKECIQITVIDIKDFGSI